MNQTKASGVTIVDGRCSLPRLCPENAAVSCSGALEWEPSGWRKSWFEISPGARILQDGYGYHRKRKGSHGAILTTFEQGAKPISSLGTQMIAKGLDFQALP